MDNVNSINRTGQLGNQTTMNEKQLSQHLRELCPVENERCEWKEFKSLKHAISGKKGERIVYVRTLIHSDDNAAGGKSIDAVATGQYL